MSALLEADSLYKRYSGVVAVDEVSFRLEEGTVLGVIGPNGAGKTTLLNLITGFVASDRGSLVLNGRSLARMRAHEIARLGLTRTFQTPFVYEDVSVVENVRRALYAVARERVVRQLRTRRHGGTSFRSATHRALALLERVSMDPSLASTLAGALPYGHRKMLNMAMVMAMDPRIVCLDEPAAGLSTSEKEKILEVVSTLKEDGVAVVLVEHDMNLVSSACEHLMVLDYGKQVAEGPTADVLRDPRVVAAYMGGADDDAPA